jgi:hypothetical protein
MAKISTTSVFFSLFIMVGIFPVQGNAQINVTTWHYDTARTGANPNETILSPSNVNSSSFVQYFSVPLDDNVYAQPLYMANVNIGGGTHSVIYAATENDSLYAIDATTGSVYWKKSFINPAAGIRAVTSNDIGCTDLSPNIGITGTPVIDPTTGTLYLVTKTYENGIFYQRLHAIDISTSGEKFGGPVVISPSAGGTGGGSSGGKIIFVPEIQNQRSALLLTNGHIIVAWGSHCDNNHTTYHGWVVSFKASTLAQETVFNVTPNGYQGGTWMSGSGLATDSNGYIYFSTGNGTYDGTTDFGDSIVKLPPPVAGVTWKPVDWFTPYNQSTLNSQDLDLGSGGVLLLPNLPNGTLHQQLLVNAGKEGWIEVVDRNNMGKFCSSCSGKDTNIVDEIQGYMKNNHKGAPAYWNGNLYYGGDADHLLLFPFNTTTGSIPNQPTHTSTNFFSGHGQVPSVSSNGNSNGVVWVLSNSTDGSQTLYAYDATDLNILWSANTGSTAVRYTTPVVANGMVYVGSQKALSAYGLAVPPGVTCSAQPQCGGSGNFAFATVGVSCSKAVDNVYTFAQICGTSGCASNSGPSGTQSSSTAFAGIGSTGTPTCTLSWGYGRGKFSETLLD